MRNTQRKALSLYLGLVTLPVAATPRAAAAQADTNVVAVDTTGIAHAAAARADSAAFADSVGQVARLLVANGAPKHRAPAVAAAVMKYARLRALDPLLVVGVIGVENASLAPRARSRAGARGVMQVMPSWLKDIRGCGRDIHDVRVNVCLGTAVLRIALDASTSVREALLRYNGCVRTPGCKQYATAVFGRAGHALLITRLDPGAAAGAPPGSADRAPARAVASARR